MKSPAVRWGLIGALIVTGLCISCFFLFNTVFLPFAVSNLSAALSERAGVEVSVGSAGYLPFRGIVLRDVELRKESGWERDGRTEPPAARSSSLHAAVPAVLVRMRPLHVVLPVLSGPAVRELVVENPEVTVFLERPAPIDGPDSASATDADTGLLRSPGAARMLSWFPGRGADTLRKWMDGLDELTGSRYFPGLLRVSGGTADIVRKDAGSEPVFGAAFDAELVHHRQDRRIELVADGRAGQGAEAGRWESRLAVRYADSRISGSLHVDDLSAETVSGSIALPLMRSLRRGLLHADLAFRLSGYAGGQESPRISAAVEGNVGLKNGEFFVPEIAPESIEGVSFSYDFQARFDSKTPIAPPRLIVSADPYAAAYTDPSLPRPYGEIVFERGDLRIGAVRLQVLPALRGLFTTESNSASEIRTAAVLDGGNDGSGENGTGAHLLSTGTVPQPVPSPARVELNLRLPETPVRTIAETVPDALLGALAEIELGGTVAWDFDIEVPMDRISHMNWVSLPELRNFRVLSLPAGMNVYRLNSSFTHLIVDDAVSYERLIAVPEYRAVPLEWLAELAERTPELIRAGRARADTRTGSGPDKHAGALDLHIADPTYRYVRLTDMSDWIPRAVLTAEDGDFFFHNGINWLTIRRAVQRNVEAQGIRFGASTLTMQIVKNLFLDQEQVFSRKLQEAFLVFLVECVARVPKERILEIYLNTAEFGPGIYGIYDASRHYFGKAPADLSASEAVWLASILPSPKRFHQYYEQGAVSDGWFARMKSYMDIMLERGRMTEEEYDEAVSNRPVFAKADEATVG